MPWARRLMWVLLGAVLLVLYLPLLPPLVSSVREADATGQFTLRWFAELWEQRLVTSAVRYSLAVAALTGVIAPALALLAAMAVRELRAPRAVMMLMLLPLFIPGVSMGLADAFLFRLLEVSPSLLTVTVVNVLWALPFAFLIVLTAMSSFDPVYLESAYLLGAGRWRAFVTVELPLIAPGVSGAALFSVILSFNETVRTSMVQGPLNTVQTYIWSTYRQVGLSPAIYALMSLLILLTLALVLVMFTLASRTRRRRARLPAR